MRRARRSGGSLLLASSLLLLASGAQAGAPTEIFAFGAFGKVSVYAPARAPEEVVLFVSGDGGWNLGVIPMAERLRDLGALVVGIDIRTYVKSLEASKVACAYPAGELEELARTVQLRHRLPEYRRPMLVGYSSGASLVYAALAAAPPESFAGAISLGFCPDLEIRKPLCRGRGLVAVKSGKHVGYDLAAAAGLQIPWMVLQGDADQVCAPEATRRYVAQVPSGRLFWLPRVGHGFSVTRNWDAQYVEAYRALAGRHEKPPPASVPGVEDLSPIEVRAQGEEKDLLAVILTGDGGWAELDKELAGALAKAGVPVVGLSSLSYFWTPRTPEGAAQDLARLLDHYTAAWKKARVLLVGYSFGADVLPFLASRLPPPLRSRVAGVALLGLSDQASFEFHVTSWLGGGGDARYLTVPEVKRLTMPVVCVRGADETDSACRRLEGSPVRVVTLPGGHHFGGDYDRLAAIVLQGGQELHER